MTRLRTPPKARKQLERHTELGAISDRQRAIRAAEGDEHPRSTIRSKGAKTTAAEPKLAAPAKAAKSTHRQPALPAPQMARLKIRSGGFCEIQLSGCHNYAIDPSHRKGTKMGGRHGEAEVKHAQLSNVLHACRRCHEWLHANSEVAKAEGAGWMVDEHEDPARRAVKYRGEMSWLIDDGRVLPYDEAAA